MKTISQKIVGINRSLGIAILLVEQNANLRWKFPITATSSRPAAG